MSHESREYESTVEARIKAEFGCPECDAERIAEAAARLRRSEDAIDWNPSFLAEKLTDAPKDYSVPEKWDWWLEYYGLYTVDLGPYKVTESPDDE